MENFYKNSVNSEISMMNIKKPKNYERKIYTSEEIQKSIENSIQNFNIIKLDSNRKKILKLKLKSKNDNLKEIEIKIKVIDSFLEFIKNSTINNNTYNEKIGKYEINKNNLLKLKEIILLEIEIIKSQLPPPYFSYF